MNGKGDKPRPLSIPYEEYADNYDRIFGRKDKSVPPDQLNTHPQTQTKRKTKHGKLQQR